MAAAAIPALVKVGSAVGGSLLGKLFSKPSKPQAAAMASTQQNSEALTGLSKQATGAAMPMFDQGKAQIAGGTSSLTQGGDYLGAAGDYYKNILGSRSAANASLALEMRTATDFYRGNENKIQRTQRGGARDYALAENDRNKVGTLASYLPGARANAATGAQNVASGYGQQAAQRGGYAQTLFGSGTNLMNTGVQAGTGAGFLNSNLFNQSTQLGEQQSKTGNSIGSMIFDILSSIPGAKGAPKMYGPPESAATYSDS